MGVGDPLFYVIGAVSLIGLVAFVVWARRMRRRLGPPEDDDRSGRTGLFPFGDQPPGMGGEGGPGRGAI